MATDRLGTKVADHGSPGTEWADVFLVAVVWIHSVLLLMAVVVIVKAVCSVR